MSNPHSEITDVNLVDSVTNAIVNAASTGSKGDGKIFITPVEESIDIGSKQSGVHIL